MSFQLLKNKNLQDSDLNSNNREKNCDKCYNWRKLRSQQRVGYMDADTNIQKIDLDKIDWRGSREFFESLGEALDKLDEKDETYDFTWVGKRKSIIEAGAPINKTLRPDVDASKNWDTTENLFIEGDNLDALKLLQESYLGKVKMIYIDPPYNTGKDFVYHDNFKANVKEYDEATEYRDNYSNIQFKKNEISNGRYHSDWLSMMYPRLKLARNLLSEDGVIFISIDDNEQANLKKLCDEVFGEDNFLTQIVWDMNNSAQSGVFKVYHQYVLAYARSVTEINVPKSTDNELFSAIAVKKIDRRHPVREFTFPKGTRFDAPNGKEIEGEWGGSVRLKIIKGKLVSENGKLKEDVTIAAGFTQMNQMKDYFNGKVNILDSRGQKVDSFYLNSSGMVQVVKERGVKALPTVQKWGNQSTASNALAGLFEIEQSLFDSPKPIVMIKDIVSWFSNEEDIVIDFFSGSATTAHAVMQLNAEDGGSRKWIMVQLPEETDEKSEAFKAGYKTIPEISRERIRRAGDKIAAENPDAKVDYGFRSLVIGDTNYKEVYKPADENTQQLLLDTVDNIKEDRTELDLLYGVLTATALELNRPLEIKDIFGSVVYLYDYFAELSGLAACFSDSVSEETIKAIATLKPLTAVFKDSSFPDSQAKVNLSEHFRIISPDTKVKVI